MKKEKIIARIIFVLSILWMIPLYLAIPEATAEFWADAVIWIGLMAGMYIVSYLCWLSPVLKNI